MHWGVIRIRIDKAVPSGELSRVGWVSPPGLQAHGTPAVIFIEALLPDGRHATILAKPEAQNVNVVVVQVGLFGDAELEHAYINMLSEVLDGDPKPVRDATFRLPEGWPEGSGKP